MKKFLSVLFIIAAVSAAQAFAEEVTDTNITHTKEYYRQQVVIAEKYTKNNFMRAVINGNTKLTEAYVKSGMDPNTTQMKLSAVMAAIGSDKPDVLKVLIKNGANIENRTMGLTPLIFAVNQKNADCVKILLENKADANNSYKNITPLYTAVSKKQFEISKMLIDAGATVDDDTVIKAVKSRKKDIRNLIIKTAAEQI